MDGELLLASQLTGARQWPHCVRGLDLDFLPLSSPRSDWPGVRSATVGGGPGAGHQAMGSRRAETCGRPSPRGNPGKAAGARGPRLSEGGSFLRKAVQRRGYRLESAA